MLHVTCAIIVKNDKVLICQRSTSMKMPLKWEFPGGKIEHGESEKDCLKREIREELGIKINLGKALTPVEHQYPNFKICLKPYISYICTLDSGTLLSKEHEQAIWVDITDLPNYDLAEADIPIVNELLKQL